MIRIESLYYAPVKSLALASLERARLEKPGIPGDRAFFIVDAEGRLATQREYGRLVQVRPSYDAATGRLELSFPDGRVVAGVAEQGEAVTTSFWEERAVEGYAVPGDWGEALSEFIGTKLTLVKAAKAGTSFDGYPLSLCSTASLNALARAAGRDAVDGRRFRQNIYISGTAPHEEDTWLGGEVRVGSALLRVKMLDPRCAMTTHSPDTGEIDLNTLKIIASYRTDQPKQANFGVYCTVAEPGEAAPGDDVVAVGR
jgi:hypothetical protein